MVRMVVDSTQHIEHWTLNIEHDRENTFQTSIAFSNPFFISDKYGNGSFYFGQMW